MNPYLLPDSDYENRPGLGGEIMRACHAFEVKAKAELDAQVRRPGEIPCTTCRRPTPLADLRGAPGRWTCTTCAALAAPTGAEAPPTEEDEMPKQIPMSREERELIVQLHQDGVPRKEIEQRVGRSHYAVSTVINRLVQEGVEAATAPAKLGGVVDALTAAEEERIRELRREGMTYAQIARETGRSASAVARTCTADPSTAERSAHDPIRPDYSDPVDAAELERLRRVNAELEAGAEEAIEELARARAELAAEREAGRRPPEARRAEVERLEMELEAALAERDAARLRVGELERELGRREVVMEGWLAGQEVEQREAVEAIQAAEADRAAMRKRLAEVEAERDRLAERLDHAETSATEADKLRGLLEIAKRQLAEGPSSDGDGPFRRQWLAQRESRRAAADLEAARERAAEAAAELEDAEAAAEAAELEASLERHPMIAPFRAVGRAAQGVANAAAAMMGVVG